MKKTSQKDFISGMMWLLVAIVIMLLIPMQVKGTRGSFFGGRSPIFFPYLSSCILFFLSVLLVFKNRRSEDLRQYIGSSSIIKKKSCLENFIRQVAIIVATVLYIYILPITGYLTSTIVFLAVLVMIFSTNLRHNWLFNCIYVFIFPLVLYYFFTKIMLVALP